MSSRDVIVMGIAFAMVIGGLLLFKVVMAL